MNDLNERTMTRAERFEKRWPLVERHGKVEIRQDVKNGGYSVGELALYDYHEYTLEDAREMAKKANNLKELGFELYGFHSVCLWDYDKIMQFVATAHPSQIKLYWLYL